LLLGVAGCGGGGHQTFRVPSESMAPTLKVGQRVDVDPGAYKDHRPQRNDIVVFFTPRGASTSACGIPSEPADGHPCERPTPAKDSRTRFIKRIVGLPGEWLYVKGNRTYVAQRRQGPYTQQPEPFIQNSGCSELCNLRKPIRIAPGAYFVLGDNRDASEDSRVWGPVPRAYVVGAVR
jgi:signal peptidase I